MWDKCSLINFMPPLKTSVSNLCFQSPEQLLGPLKIFSCWLWILFFMLSFRSRMYPFFILQILEFFHLWIICKTLGRFSILHLKTTGDTNFCTQTFLFRSQAPICVEWSPVASNSWNIEQMLLGTNVKSSLHQCKEMYREYLARRNKQIWTYVQTDYL